MKKLIVVCTAILTILLISLPALAGCGHSKGMNSPRELTEEEKARVIEIALNTPQVSEWLDKEPEYRVVRFDWYAVWDSGWAMLNDIRPTTIPESAAVYPGVTLANGEEVTTQMLVVVDLETEKPVLVEGPYPPGGPLPAKPAPKPTSIPPAREAIVLVKSQEFIGPVKVRESMVVEEFKVPIMVRSGTAAEFELRLENRTGRGEAINFAYGKSNTYTELIRYKGSTGDEWVLVPVEVTYRLRISGIGD